MLKLKFFSARNPRLAPLLDGTVKPGNIEFEIVTSPPGDLFYHNLLHDDFDVSEMSISECLIVRISDPIPNPCSLIPVPEPTVPGITNPNAGTATLEF